MDNKSNFSDLPIFEFLNKKVYIIGIIRRIIMNEQDIINFRAQVANYTLEELQQEQIDIQNAISKMILDSDLILKAAIVDTLIKEKQNG